MPTMELPTNTVRAPFSGSQKATRRAGPVPADLRRCSRPARSPRLQHRRHARLDRAWSDEPLPGHCPPPPTAPFGSVGAHTDAAAENHVEARRTRGYLICVVAGHGCRCDRPRGGPGLVGRRVLLVAGPQPLRPAWARQRPLWPCCSSAAPPTHAPRSRFPFGCHCQSAGLGVVSRRSGSVNDRRSTVHHGTAAGTSAMRSSTPAGRRPGWVSSRSALPQAPRWR